MFFLRLCTLVFCVMSLSPAAWAFKVSPMVQSFAPSGKNATQNFVIENTGDKTLAVQVSAKARGFDDKGNEVRNDTQDLTIYPPQFSLDPGKKRLVRVSYVGKADIKTEAAYRLIFQQLPVDFKDPKKKQNAEPVNINFLLRYLASLYVTPENTRAVLDVSEVRIEKGTLYFTLHNSGSAHQVLSRAQIGLREEGKEIVTHNLPEKSVEDRLGAENLLPGMKKSYALPLEDRSIDSKKKWTLEIKTDKAL